MKILTYSSLYPNAGSPAHGIFVERRLQKLMVSTDIEATVVAPVPWFPFRSGLFGGYAKFAAVAPQENRHGIAVHHPRYPVVPKVGMTLAPLLMNLATRKSVETVIRQSGPCALIDAHYFYPDGVAAAALSKHFGIPLVITARGSDINLIAKYPRQREMILSAARHACAVIAVSQSLADAMAEIGIAREKISVLRNGVDLAFFNPDQREDCRRALNIDDPTLLSVGVLKEAKGHDLAIEALSHLDRERLIVVGDGPDRQRLEKLALAFGVAERVEFTGALDAEALRTRYRAADALFLMSRREGMPNVVLESIACGTPVLATDVGGVSEVLTSPIVGRLVKTRSAKALAEAWRSFGQDGIDRDAIRRFASRLGWDETIDGLASLFRRCATP